MTYVCRHLLMYISDVNMYSYIKILLIYTFSIAHKLHVYKAIGELK